MTGDSALMGRFASGPWLRGMAWAIFGAVSVANVALVASWVGAV